MQNNFKIDTFARGLSDKEMKYPLHLKLEMFAIQNNCTQAEAIKIIAMELKSLGY